MIVGIGADLCDIKRMAAQLDDRLFLKRFFEETEQAYILARGAFAAASMAGCFAAKEAFVKALGSGFSGIPPEDIVVMHRENGAPYYRLKGLAQEAAQKRGVTSLFLSISHEGGLALAFAVLEG